MQPKLGSEILNSGQDVGAAVDLFIDLVYK